MKFPVALSAALVVGASLLAAPVASAASHTEKAKAAPAAAPATDAAHEAMMAEMMKYAMPGAEHKALEALVGTWKATVKSWFAPGEPTVSEGVMVNTMAFSGRCVEGRYKGMFMGMPMEGLSLMGFDNKKKEYWSFWADNMSTAPTMQTGPAGADGKTIVVKGMMDGMDGTPAETVSTTKVVDADTHVYTMAGKMGDQMVTMMEITYTRSK